MPQVWQTEESSKLGSEEGNCSGCEGLMVMCSKSKIDGMEELEDMVNQKLNSMISLVEQRFEEIDQSILAIGQTVKKLEVAVEKLLVSCRSNIEKTIQDTKQRCMKLKFNSNISVPFLTGEQIKGEGGNNLQLSLIDNCTGAIVDFGREASAQVEIVALEGDLDDDDEGDAWTAEEFQSKIARDREGKRSVLAGKLQLKLNKGTVSLSDVKFRSSQRYNGGIFKLGACVVDTFDGGQVIEAKTKSFQVNDYRKKYNQKHHPPSASDEVWRLENIGKGGPIHDRLKGANVNHVKDFQTRLSEDPEELKCLVGLPAKKWEATVNHAQACIPDNMVGQVPPPAYACNVSVASGDEDEGVSFDVGDPLLQIISPSSNIVELLSSPRLEHFRGQDTVATEMGECDPTILNNSFECTLSSIHHTSFGKVESRNTNCTDNVEIMNRLHSSSQGLGSFSPSDSPVIDFDEVKNWLDEDPGVGSCTSHNQKKSWTLLFTVSKWFSRRKRTTAFERNHIQKKQRICY
ncbi:calmodulin-binding protein 60 A-like [Coffea arabica]|uniref:Calmodulin-binding protein 60 A-like n=1 Tax=Coffea arabica TaxID=13443 RepID=A0A6P6XDZ9_COFAR|nr:calmodulin-binding protein 60 A-like [Coffea arabica]